MRKYRAVITLEFVVLIVLIMVLFYALMGISTVQGNSMYPILHSGEKVVYNQRVSDYKAGDVIVLKRPDGEEFVKRIVAVAGDTVNIQNGKLYVNGAEVLPMFPNEAVWYKKEKPVQINIIHDRLNRSSQTSEVINRHTGSIARQNLVNKYRYELT